MLSPFLIVGVGGSGGKTLRALRSNLEDRLTEIGWGDRDLPAAWQFLHVDSPTNQDGKEFPFDYLPVEDYVGLVPPGIAYRQQFAAALNGIPEKFRSDIQNALPSDLEVRVPVDLGAGMYRAIGRTLALAKMGEIQKSVKLALQRISGPDATSQLESLSQIFGGGTTGARPDVTVVVVSSIAGGSGAGQFLDVAEAIKSAAFAEPWIHKIFSVLYAPDVFRNVPDSSAIAPNALFTMAESMSGMWTKNIPQPTIELYQSKGVNVAGNGNDPKVHIGPRYNYIVGLQNSSVNFENQLGVYKAVAASLSTWVTSEIVQSKIGAYTIANFDAAVGAMNIDDNSGIKVPNTESAPFASLGFGRISLGRDIFAKYAAERITQGAINTLLNEVVRMEPTPLERTREEYIESSAANSFGDFIQELKLNEDGKSSTDVLSQVRPLVERQSISAQFRAEISQGSQQGVNSKGNQAIEGWVSKVGYFYAQGIGPKIEIERERRKQLVLDWVQAQQELTLRVVSKYAAQKSIQVSSALVDKLIAAVQKSSLELAKLGTESLGWSTRFEEHISGAFNVGTQEVLPLEHPMVQNAIDRAVQCFGFRAEGELLDLTSSLLKDFAENFLTPLKAKLDSTYIALSNSILQKTEEANGTQYSGWPEYYGSQVPARFSPARNEYLLLDIDQYDSEFKSIRARSLGDRGGRNIDQDVITQVLMGAFDPVVATQVTDKTTWQLIEAETFWIPQRAEARDSGATSSSARFDISNSPDTYLRRTKNWLYRKGTAFEEYLTEDFRKYLDENSPDQARFQERLGKFREQLSGAVKASKPLIKLNAGLMQLVHGTEPKSGTTLSVIPFGKGSQVYETAKEIFVSEKIWDENVSPEWFDSSAQARRIDIFTLQNPYQPIVMDSILEPIGQTWLRSRNDAAGRQDFLRWRKARPLNEAIAASPDVWKRMLRGWYVAKVLGQLKPPMIDIKLGPKLELWNGAQDEGYKTFPYPLLHVTEPSTLDYPGLVLSSLSIALVACNLENSLTALDPYKRLLELSSTAAGSPLFEWVVSGKVDLSGPKVDPSRGGPGVDEAGSENWIKRRDAVTTYLRQQIVEFTKVSEIDVKPGMEAPFITWEIRHEVIEALELLIGEVSLIEPQETGV
jgi:Tubulin like